MEKNLEKLFKLLLKDIKVELDDEFHLNFQRKAFFTHRWKQARYNQTGSLLIRTGALRKSLASSISGQNSIRWTSSLPYAQLHNAGGRIVVTPKMKKYFWYKHLQAAGHRAAKGKRGTKKAVSIHRISPFRF